MISIVLATHNGEKTLPRLFDALLGIHLPPAGIEIIAVDNGSTDRSMDVLRRYANRLPLTLLREPRRGKNRALNAALPHVRGELVALTDDDVMPEPDWLVAYTACAAAHPDRDLFGGVILPCWDSPPPSWLFDVVPIGATFGLTPATLQSGPVDPGMIWGGNMMVRRRIFDAGLRFDETIGPSEGQYMMGSETEFNTRAVAAGHATWFCREAQVRHIIRDYQLEPGWLTRRGFRVGRNKCYRDYLPLGGRSAERWGFGSQNYPRWMLRKQWECRLRSLWARWRGDPIEAVRLRWDAEFHAGYIRQAQYLATLRNRSRQST
ncbi:MAG: glycosyltransferase [Burkholderiales bacterium]|nr:glycosyltransferase [Burkholderiales bacterium]